MKIVGTFVLLTTAIFVSCSSKRPNQGGYAQSHDTQPPKKIVTHFALDTVIEKTVPLTLSGDRAEVTYHLVVQSWNKPVSWNMTVTFGGDTLLSEESHEDSFDDTALTIVPPDSIVPPDQFLGVKKEWYLSGILYVEVDTVSTVPNSRFRTEPISKELARSFFKIKSDTALVYDFWRDYATKRFIVLSFWTHPGPGWSPIELAYYPKAHRFVPIYHE